MYRTLTFFIDLLSTQEMKSMIYNAVEEAPSIETVEPSLVTRHFARFDEEFITYCEKELAKINTFYSGKNQGFLKRE